MSDELFGFGPGDTSKVKWETSCDKCKELTKIYDELIARIDKLVEDKRKLKEVLEFYADTEKNAFAAGAEFIIDSDYYEDFGNRAKQTLKELS